MVASISPLIRKGQGYQPCLSSYQLKIIAVIIMTIDHIGAFCTSIPFVETYYDIFRAIGRIAAPIFLFTLVQSLYHTHSKKDFVLRLYKAAFSVGLFDFMMNVFYGKELGIFRPGNIFYTFFYIALFVWLGEELISAWKNQNSLKGLKASMLLLLSIIPTLLYKPIFAVSTSLAGGGATEYQLNLILDLQNAIIPSMVYTDYGIGFIVLGLILYIAGTKRTQCLCFFVFWLWSLIFTLTPGMQEGFIPYILSTFCFKGQLWMILSLPFMIAYNGERGKPSKQFFYVYYPTHRQILRFAAALLGS